MGRLIVQKHALGCGVACVASVMRCSYDDVIKTGGISNKKVMTEGFSIGTSFVFFLKQGISASYFYVKQYRKKHLYRDGSIVFIARSKCYLYGHYPCRMQKRWMDPWINGPDTECDLLKAKASFRKRLPVKAICVIF